MSISAYKKKMEYTSLSDTGVGFLDESGSANALIANCDPITNARIKSVGRDTS